MVIFYSYVNVYQRVIVATDHPWIGASKRWTKPIAMPQKRTRQSLRPGRASKAMDGISPLKSYVIFPMKMVIFHSYVSLPGGKMYNWLVVDLPLWKMMEFVSWDDDIPNWMEKEKMFQTTNQHSKYVCHFVSINVLDHISTYHISI